MDNEIVAYRGQKMRPTISRRNLHSRREEELSYFKPIKITEIKKKTEIKKQKQKNRNKKTEIKKQKLNLTYSK